MLVLSVPAAWFAECLSRHRLISGGVRVYLLALVDPGVRACVAY